MSTLPNPSQRRAYPLIAPTDDRRFTLGLVFAVAAVLADAGFPAITSGGDLVALQQALYGFIYRTPAVAGGGVSELLHGAGPIPPWLDAEAVTALRRIVRHFAEHGRLAGDQLGDDFDRSQAADADETPLPVGSRRHPARLEDARTGEVIRVAGGHVVHECCGKVDDAPHANYCEHYRPGGAR